MMAVDYYTLQQTLNKLALTQDQLSHLVREGRLREFRVEGEQRYKVAEVDDLAAELNPSVGTTGDGASESAIELLPVDSTDGGSDVITLDESGEHTPTQDAPKNEDTVITPAGVNVFDEDELAGLDADPMAKTQIAPSVSEELSIEGGGSSGSGLLDLSRESDDTSLGGVLDEIYSGHETLPDSCVPATAEAAEAAGFEEVEEPVPAAAPAPRVVAATAADPMAGLFSGFLVASLILLGFAGFVAASLTAGVLPGILQTIASNILYPVLGAVLVTVISVVVGFFIGRR